MRLPRNCVGWLLILALLPLGAERPASAAPAAPPASPVKSVGTPSPTLLPDYGGRDSVVSAAVEGSGAQTMNPMAQAGRAFEALVIVLALVVGSLYLLKRSGLIKATGTAAMTAPWALRRSSARPKPSAVSEGSTDLISVLGSQILPHGAGVGLHLISVGGKTLLLGETAQSVTLLTELDFFTCAQDTPQDRAAFAEYLAKAGIALKPSPSVRPIEDALSSTVDRLQSLLSRSRGEKVPL